MIILWSLAIKNKLCSIWLQFSLQNLGYTEHCFILVCILFKSIPPVKRFLHFRLYMSVALHTLRATYIKLFRLPVNHCVYFQLRPLPLVLGLTFLCENLSWSAYSHKNLKKPVLCKPLKRNLIFLMLCRYNHWQCLQEKVARDAAGWWRNVYWTNYKIPWYREIRAMQQWNICL